MKQPKQEDLLGFVLGALDAPEQRDLQQYIDANPETEEQLLEIRNAMSPLDSLEAEATGHRPGLARRTCELVAGLQHGQQQNELETSPPINNLFVEPPSNEESTRLVEPASNFAFSRFTDRLSHPLSWSRVDMLAAVAFIAILSGILLPAIAQSRFNSRVMACQHNLAQVGTAMLTYSDLHSGRYINVPNFDSSLTETSFASGLQKTSFSSGLFAPVLKTTGFIKDDATFSCAGVATLNPVSIPTINQLASAEGEQQETLRRRMGGHFGYGLGFVEGDRYSAPRNDGSAHRVILADMPSVDLPGRGSNNHAGKGQNCFFADGHIQFVSTHTIGDDAIYENDFGMVGPGAGPRDNVIAPSHLPPVQIEFINQ